MTDYTEQIKAQDQEVESREAKYTAAYSAEDRAINARMKAEKALDKARQRRKDLDKLASGKRPYLCGKPYENVHHGDAYKTTVVTGIEDEIQWWDTTEVAAKRESPYPFVYIVALADDCKTYTALVFLSERAKVKAGKLRKLVKLPEAPV
ncbi:hypothetical protein N9917_03510 [Deltaproteobacteria bacterium]|nr:hypothetical protein [Deltaproteobacteria bacterium]